MPPKNQPSKRNAHDFDSVTFLSPDYVTELRDNPDDFSNPLKVGRILPGTRVALKPSGCPFEFIVRVAPDQAGRPQVVDLRMRSPVARGDVPITNADLKQVPIAALAAAAMNPPMPGVEVTHDVQPVAEVARRPGRPTKLTDDFLRDVTRLAREAWREDFPINDFVAAALVEEGKIRKKAKEPTVRGWRKAAAARRRESPDDDSFLRSGELRGKPRKTSHEVRSQAASARGGGNA
jgi:hypothetical protein